MYVLSLQFQGICITPLKGIAIGLVFESIIREVEGYGITEELQCAIDISIFLFRGKASPVYITPSPISRANLRHTKNI